MNKRLEKAEKILGEEYLAEMNNLIPGELRSLIAEANNAMEQVVAELEENVKYQTIKEQKQDMEAGKRDVDKRQKAIIVCALARLNSPGEK